MVFTPRLFAALTSVASLFNVMHAKNYRVTVAPTDVERAAQVVVFQLPSDAARLSGLKQRDGTILPVQVSNGTATFVIPLQKRGESLTFTLIEGAPASNAVDAKRDAGRLHLLVRGKPVFDYQMDKDAL